MSRRDVEVGEVVVGPRLRRLPMLAVPRARMLRLIPEVAGEVDAAAVEAVEAVAEDCNRDSTPCG
jgi:hypothetical protein